MHCIGSKLGPLGNESIFASYFSFRIPIYIIIIYETILFCQSVIIGIYILPVKVTWLVFVEYVFLLGEVNQSHETEG